MSTGARSRSFALDRRIPLTLLFGFLLQSGGALFWAGAAAERIAEVERETRANATAVERVVRLETKVEAMHEAIVRMESKLDRITVPLPAKKN